MFKSALILVGTGFCFGLGFYLCRKCTDAVDRKLAEKLDPEIQALLKKAEDTKKAASCHVASSVVGSSKYQSEEVRPF